MVFRHYFETAPAVRVGYFHWFLFGQRIHLGYTGAAQKIASVLFYVPVWVPLSIFNEMVLL